MEKPSPARGENAMSPDAFTDAAATWNKRFDAEDYIFGLQPNEFLRTQARLLTPGSHVLCVADGEGRNSVWLARQGMRVDAFDIAEVGVAKASKLAAASGATVTFSVCDCDHWAWTADTYDAVVAIFVQFADPAMRERLFRNMVRTLKPGGLLVLQGYTPKQLEYKTGGPPILSHLYSADMLRSAFAQLQLVELSEYEADLTEGTQHHGRSALVGLVGRKV
jgi:2-polyprenyl-3-methyl-5-hydroxy-6-metoxy-1,4-benzoquinol methylase